MNLEKGSKVNNPFYLNSNEYLDTRMSVDLLADLTTLASTTLIPDGFLCFCKENKKRYEYSIDMSDPLNPTPVWTIFGGGAEWENVTSKPFTNIDTTKFDVINVPIVDEAGDPTGDSMPTLKTKITPLTKLEYEILGTIVGAAEGIEDEPVDNIDPNMLYVITDDNMPNDEVAINDGLISNHTAFSSEKVRNLLADKSDKGHIHHIGEIIDLTESLNNIKNKISSLTNAMVLKGEVTDLATLNTITGMEPGWVYFVGTTGTKTQYVYVDEVVGWISLGTTDIEIRDFTLNPIKLDAPNKEVKGILPIENIPQNVVNKNTNLALDTISKNIEGAINELNSTLTNKVDKVKIKGSAVLTHPYINSGDIQWYIKNGFCTVSIWNINISAPLMHEIIYTELPNSDIVIQGTVTLTDGTNNTSGFVYMIPNSGKLVLRCSTTNTPGFCSFTYPIPE